MASYKELFPQKNTIFPVVHVENMSHAVSNTEIAHTEGADGVFLISMNGMRASELLNIQNFVKDNFPKFFVGINLLDKNALDAFNYLNHYSYVDQPMGRFSKAKVDALWIDDARIDERKEEQWEADAVKLHRRISKFQGLYFGGVAFKYTRQVDDVEGAARIGKEYVDVVTTSGTQTGSAPAIEKIVRMKNAIGDYPLAVASGISHQNVEQFKPYVDTFLVASSLLKSFTENFDPIKMRDLVQIVKA